MVSESALLLIYVSLNVFECFCQCLLNVISACLCFLIYLYSYLLSMFGWFCIQVQARSKSYVLANLLITLNSNKSHKSSFSWVPEHDSHYCNTWENTYTDHWFIVFYSEHSKYLLPTHLIYPITHIFMQVGVFCMFAFLHFSTLSNI